MKRAGKLTGSIVSRSALLWFAALSPARIAETTDSLDAAPSFKTPQRKPKPRAKPLAPLDLEDIVDADLKAAWEREQRTRWTFPSTSVTSPVGFGAPWGLIYAGINFQSRVSNS